MTGHRQMLDPSQLADLRASRTNAGWPIRRAHELATLPTNIKEGEAQL